MIIKEMRLIEESNILGICDDGESDVEIRLYECDSDKALSVRFNKKSFISFLISTVGAL